MILIVDTNRIIAGLMKDSITREILLNTNFEFYIPEYLLLEIEKHKELILKKSGLSESRFQLIFDLLKENINVVSMSKIIDYIDEAEEIIGDIDPNDIPFIALALAIQNEGIWTEDKDFRKQSKIKIWSTAELIKVINSKKHLIP